MVIIADDLTGACDTGAGFAHAGLRTFVVLDMQRGPVDVDGVDVLVYSTESRYLPVEQAVRAVERAAHNIARHSPSVEITASTHDDRLKPRPPTGDAWVYKKIDSTLRGHPGAELAALMRTLNATRALVAPAFPAQGRTTMDGQLLVNGQGLAQTPFAAEAGSGDLRAVFGGRGYPVYSLGLDDVRRGNTGLTQLLSQLNGIVVADAETDADLATLAASAQTSGTQILCGSAGLADALSRVGTSQKAGASPAPTRHVPCRPVLVIAGSRNPVTVSQIEVARGHGVTVIAVPPEFGQDDDTVVGAGLALALWSAPFAPAPFAPALWSAPAPFAPAHVPTAAHVAAPIGDVARAAVEGITAGRDIIVTTAGLSESPLGKDMIAKRLGMLAAQMLACIRPGALVLTGGDVATAVCTALGAQSLQLLDELQPGIALGTLADGAYAGLYVITKAGGFGRAESLWEIISEIGDQGFVAISTRSI